MTDSSLSMGVASLSDALKITVIPPDAAMNGAVFLGIMQESGRALQEGDNLITAIANHPRIAEAIPLSIEREKARKALPLVGPISKPSRQNSSIA